MASTKKQAARYTGGLLCLNIFLQFPLYFIRVAIPPRMCRSALF